MVTSRRAPITISAYCWLGRAPNCRIKRRGERLGGLCSLGRPPDAPLCPARRPVGADQGPAARTLRACGRDRQGQPPLRGGRALPLPRRHSLALSAGAVRRLEEGPHPLLTLGQERGVGE